MRAPPAALSALMALSALSAGTATLVGCGGLDGETEPFVGTVRYKEPMGAFEIRLLQPPWLPPFSYEGETIFVVPAASATAAADLGVVLSDALYSLRIAPVSGAPADVAGQEAATAPSGAMVSRRDMKTASGAGGVDLAWASGPATFHRAVLVAAPGTRTFRLRFTAKRAIADDPMVGQMIASFKPGS